MYQSTTIQVKSKETGTFRFHCRMDISVYKWYCCQAPTIHQACQNALKQFADGIRGGIIRLNTKSQFLERKNKSQKHECVILITKSEKEWIEKIAFNLCISQSEILRMALEWWMEVKNPKTDAVSATRARDKWHYGVITFRPFAVHFNLWGNGTVTLNAFPTIHDAEDGLRATSSA